MEERYQEKNSEKTEYACKFKEDWKIKTSPRK